MSVLDVDTANRPAPTRMPSPAGPTPTGPVPTRTGRRNGRAGRPRLKPVGAVPAPTVAPSGSGVRARACGIARVARPEPRSVTQPATRGWRLTDRGIAVVLVVAAMLTVAALAVVVPTALRVTGENFQPSGTSQLARP